MWVIVFCENEEPFEESECEEGDGDPDRIDRVPSLVSIDNGTVGIMVVEVMWVEGGLTSEVSEAGEVVVRGFASESRHSRHQWSPRSSSVQMHSEQNIW